MCVHTYVHTYVFVAKPVNDHENSITLQNWNPMEDDYLSKRNIYKIDDEDCGLALEGYSKSFHCFNSVFTVHL